MGLSGSGGLAGPPCLRPLRTCQSSCRSAFLHCHGQLAGSSLLRCALPFTDSLSARPINQPCISLSGIFCGPSYHPPFHLWRAALHQHGQRRPLGLPSQAPPEAAGCALLPHQGSACTPLRARLVLCPCPPHLKDFR